MRGKTSLFQPLCRIVLFAVLSAALFFVLCPSIEETQTESRIAVAYRDVCRIADSNSTGEIDPWGNPYRTANSGNGRMAISNGPNRVTSSTGVDHDDIHSFMTDSPIEAVRHRKHRQLLVAGALPVFWLLGSIVYLTIWVRNSSRTQVAG